ncbi:MAG: hypothetical protein ACOH5I_08000 [Oligoflexus sp.]
MPNTQEFADAIQLLRYQLLSTLPGTSIPLELPQVSKFFLDKLKLAQEQKQWHAYFRKNGKLAAHLGCSKSYLPSGIQ